MADLIPNYAPAPDGKSMASLLKGEKNTRLWQSFVIPESGDYVLSIFVSGNGGGEISMSLGEIGENPYVFNPDIPAGVGNGSFEPINVAGWFKVSIERSLQAGSATVSFKAEGDKTAGVVIFGGSLGRTAGLYIPTTNEPRTVTDYQANPLGVVTFDPAPSDGDELLWEGSYQYFVSDIDVTNDDLYLDIRRFLLGLFPDDSQKIIKAMQNNQPLPEGAIVMNLFLENNLDESVTTYWNEAEARVQNSVESRLQLDFYGPEAQRKSRIVYNVWKNYYAADRLKSCQPLYVHSYGRHPYINDSNNYEDRWILDLGLQYNPTVTHAQDFAEDASVIIRPEP